MEPIQNLLHRIRWDPEFGFAQFVIGYYDRTTQSMVRIPFESITFEPGQHFFFKATGEDGAVHDIPFHRVREVYRNGKLIWQRPP